MECYESFNWKIKIKSTNIPRRFKTNKVDVCNKSELANTSNGFFTNIGQKLASQITKSYIMIRMSIKRTL